MSNREKIVDDDGAACNNEQDEWRTAAPTSAQIKARLRRKVDEIFGFLEEPVDRTFDAVEQCAISLVFALGRLFLAYFLARRHEHSTREVEAMKRQGLRVRPPQPKLLGTYFGKVRYWRTYLRRPGGSGVHPLDTTLGITTASASTS